MTLAPLALRAAYSSLGPVPIRAEALCVLALAARPARDRPAARPASPSGRAYQAESYPACQTARGSPRFPAYRQSAPLKGAPIGWAVTLGACRRAAERGALATGRNHAGPKARGRAAGPGGA